MHAHVRSGAGVIRCQRVTVGRARANAQISVRFLLPFSVLFETSGRWIIRAHSASVRRPKSQVDLYVMLLQNNRS